jgi:hypothetical protein
MQKPVLNANSGKYKVSEGQDSAAGRGRKAHFRIEGQRKRRSRNAISAKLRKSTQRLAKLSSSVRRQREQGSSSSSSSISSSSSSSSGGGGGGGGGVSSSSGVSSNKYRSPMSIVSKQFDQGPPTGGSMCSPPSPTLEQMAVQQSSGEGEGSTFASTFLTASFGLLDRSDEVSDAVSDMLPTSTARRSKRTRKKHNIVRQLQSSF